MDKACQVDLELEEAREKAKLEKLEKKQSEKQHAAWKHKQKFQCKVESCEGEMSGIAETPRELRLSFKDIVLAKMDFLKSPVIERIRPNPIDKQDSIDVAFDDYFKQKDWTNKYFVGVLANKNHTKQQKSPHFLQSTKKSDTHLFNQFVQL